MPNFQLQNTASQLNQTVSEHYSRLLNNFVGPLTAGDSSSLFCIQNGAKGLGLSIANNCMNFYANNLNFNNTNSNLVLCIPPAANFILTGNGATMRFNANGTLSVGQDIDLNYKGLQVVNVCPGIVLKDCDSINGTGCQFITFFDRTGYCQAQISYEQRNITVEGNVLNSNVLNINSDLNLRIGNRSGSAILLRNKKLSILAGDCTFSNTDIYIGTGVCIQGGLCVSGICSYGGICNYSNQNCQSFSGENYFTMRDCLNGSHRITFNNKFDLVHSYIRANQSLNSTSSINFFTTPVPPQSILDQMNAPVLRDIRDIESTKLAMVIGSKCSFCTHVDVWGDFCSHCGCFSTICTSNFRNMGSLTYIGHARPGCHRFISANVNTDSSQVITESTAYCILFSSSNRACGHKWSVFVPAGLGVSDRPLTYDALGLTSLCNISTCCNLVGSGSLIISNFTGQTTIYQNQIRLLATSPNNSGIFTSGDILSCFGSFRHSGLIEASGICSTANNTTNCFQSRICSPLFSTSSSYISGSANSTDIGICTSNAICANLIYANSCVCASLFCQKSNFENKFCGNLLVGSTCECVVKSKNTVKAWGTVCIVNGWVANNSQMNSYYNLNSVVHNSLTANNNVYVISLSEPIKAPISANFSVRLPYCGYPYLTGSGVYNNTSYDTIFASGIMPVTANLINYGKNVQSNAVEDLKNGFSYNCLFFTMTNHCLAQTFWGQTWGTVVAGNPNPFNLQLSILGAFQGTLGNYLKGIIDFSIYGS